MKSHNLRRLFIGWECEISSHAPLPEGRQIHPAHMTLIFFGDVQERAVEKIKGGLIPFSSLVAPCLIATNIAFLPEKEQRVAALIFEDTPQTMLDYQKALASHMQKMGLSLDTRSFFPHVSLLRRPFDKLQVEKWFTKQPVPFRSIHLFESKGQLTYDPIATIEVLAPFEQIEHTADLAFCIRGKDYSELLYHAMMALSFSFPPFFPFINTKNATDLSDVVYTLNRQVSLMDKEIGSPFKAISYSGSVIEEMKGVLTWEMIIDV